MYIDVDIMLVIPGVLVVRQQRGAQPIMDQEVMVAREQPIFMVVFLMRSTVILLIRMNWVVVPERLIRMMQAVVV